MVAMSDLRSLPIPDGLEGERLDAALARMFGLSRTRAAELAAEGRVRVDGSEAGKSDRVRGGAWLEIELPAAADPVAVKAEAVEGMRIVHDDEDIVVIDKPVGVAAHPSPGWLGTTVVGGLAAAGYRISTSGASERQGVVHRLDVGTSGLMVVAKSERAYTLLKQAFRDRTVDKRYHTLVQGHPDPMRGTVDAPIGRHPHHDYKFAVVRGGRTASRTTRRSRPTARRRCWRSSSRPAARTRSACTWPPCATPASATCSTARTRRWGSGWAWDGSGCTR